MILPMHLENVSNNQTYHVLLWMNVFPSTFVLRSEPSISMKDRLLRIKVVKMPRLHEFQLPLALA